MRKITALIAHLQQITGLPREHIRAYADKGDLSTQTGQLQAFARGACMPFCMPHEETACGQTPASR